MSKNLSEQTRQIAVTEIVRHGEKLTLPEDMTLDQGIDLLQRRKEFEQEKTVFFADFDVFPYDGAHALDVVLVNKFGWAPAVATPGFFGDNPPAMIDVEYDYGKFRSVAWGRFKLPNISGFISTDVTRKEGRIIFRLTAQVLRKDEFTVRGLFDDVRKFINDGGSIYKGKAIKLRFCDDNGSPLSMPQPKFLDTTKIDPAGLIYSEDVMSLVQNNLYIPIRRVKDLIANNIPVKRGVLLGGTYGTGKTMAATVASKYAVDNGITYVYVPRASEFAHAVEFAKQYQSPACVIFVEDIDRVTDGERTVEMDDILNIIDGIDTKSSHIITVVTTNSLETIEPAMLRPGRLDAVIEVTAPDAQAVQKLIRYYGGDAIAPDADLTAAGQLLDGQIPAVVAEVVKRAKLYQISLQEPGTKVQLLTGDALANAAATMASQLALLKTRIEDSKKLPPSLEDNLRTLVATAVTTQLSDNAVVAKLAETIASEM